VSLLIRMPVVPHLRCSNASSFLFPALRPGLLTFGPSGLIHHPLQNSVPSRSGLLDLTLERPGSSLTERSSSYQPDTV
jgi:hypothetical protein